MYSLDLIGRGDASWRFAALSLLGGLGVGAIAALHANRQTHPLVDLTALRLRSYAVTIWGGSLFRVAISSIPFLLPLLFQVGFGLDAFASGLLLLAVFAGNLVMKPFTTPILRRFRFRDTLFINGVLNAGTIFACAFLTPTTPVAVIVIILFVGGLTRSMQFTALSTLAFADVPEDRMTGANTLFSMVQQMAMGMGVALGAVMLRLAGLFDPGAPGVIPIASFHIAFVAIGVIALLGMFDVVGLSAAAGDEVRQRRAQAKRSGRKLGAS
jgi:Na+/melibiose symporter-like transporter